MKPSVPQPSTQPPSRSAARHSRLLLIRHAEVEARYQGVFGGRIDMELSPRGHEQAAALASVSPPKAVERHLRQPDEARAADAGPVLVNGAPKPVILPDLREVDFGDWTGLAWDEVQAKFGVSAFAWLEQLECDGIANAECAETLPDRVEPCLRQILAAHSGQQVAIFCHGGMIRVLLAHSAPLAALADGGVRDRIRQPHPGPGCGRSKAELQLLNFTPWREILRRLLPSQPDRSLGNNETTMLWKISVTTTPKRKTPSRNCSEAPLASPSPRTPTPRPAKRWYQSYLPDQAGPVWRLAERTSRSGSNGSPGQRA